jgi:hypothetical protein
MPHFEAEIAGAVPRPVFALHECQDQDAPASARDQLRREGAYRVGGAVQVVVDYVPPVGVLHVQQRLPTLDGRVGDDDVDLAMIALHLVGARSA